MACIFGHKWKGCKCEICGKTKHDLNGCMCRKCFKTQHVLDGCVCTRCGETQHKWTTSCKCTKCGEPCDENGSLHKWDGCKCKICGMLKSSGHKYVEQDGRGYICSTCGKKSDHPCMKCGIDKDAISAKQHAQHKQVEKAKAKGASIMMMGMTPSRDFNKCLKCGKIACSTCAAEKCPFCGEVYSQESIIVKSKSPFIQ